MAENIQEPKISSANMAREASNKKSIEIRWIGPNAKGVIGVGGVAIAIFSCYQVVKVCKNRFGRKNRGVEGGRKNRVVEAESKERVDRPFQRSVSLAALHGGNLAIKRILKAQRARAKASDTTSLELERKLKKLSDPNYGEDFEKRLHFGELEKIIMKLEAGGKVTEALIKLEDAKRVAESKKLHQEVYELDMLIVEMLIYNGDYERALNRECMKDVTKDARRSLYKTVINIMLGQDEEGKKCWAEFQEVRSQFDWPVCDCPVEEADVAKLDFTKFKKAVNSLKMDIDAARNTVNTAK